MKTEFLTPVGRLVQGDPFVAQDKDQHGKPLMTMAGQPTQRYFIAVAFRKGDAAFDELYGKIHATARAGFPALFNAQGQCTHPRFSFKVIDGDGIDDNGKQNALKEGFAGHWILKFQSSFAPRCFYAGRYAPQDQIADPKAIPRGYYVRVSGTIEPNGNPQKPGVYVNLNMVELAGGSAADVIVSGPDAAAVFGGAAAALPPGVAAALPGVPGQPATPGGYAPTPGQPAAAMPAAALPGALPGQPATHAAAALPVAPNPGILNGPGGVPAVPGMPTPPGAVPAAPAAPVFQMTAAAQGFTRDQYIAQGWTDAQLRAQGMML